MSGMFSKLNLYTNEKPLTALHRCNMRGNFLNLGILIIIVRKHVFRLSLDLFFSHDDSLKLIQQFLEQRRLQIFYVQQYPLSKKKSSILCHDRRLKVPAFAVKRLWYILQKPIRFNVLHTDEIQYKAIWRGLNCSYLRKFVWKIGPGRPACKSKIYFLLHISHLFLIFFHIGYGFFTLYRYEKFVALENHYSNYTPIEQAF